MAFPVRVCALIGKFTDSRVAESAHALIPYLQSRQVEVLMSEDAPMADQPAHVARCVWPPAERRTAAFHPHQSR